MADYIAPLQTLIEQFQRLPGVGHKTAVRYALAMLQFNEDETEKFADAVIGAKRDVHSCKRCFNISTESLCPICQNHERDESVICVVEDPRDVGAFERTREYNGLYHVLHGVISPMAGVGPDQLRLKQLLVRVADTQVQEVIMATNPTVEGEATAMYLSRLLKPFDVKVTRLAYGIPVGGELEYADEVTLQRSLEGRREL